MRDLVTLLEEPRLRNKKRLRAAGLIDAILHLLFEKEVINRGNKALASRAASKFGSVNEQG
jgi:hypothetical protein